MSTEPNRLRRHTTTFIRAALAACLLVLVFRIFADFSKTLAYIRHASSALLLVGFIMAVLGEVLTAYKWKLLLKHIGHRISLWDSTRVSFIGMFYNNLLPGSLGGDLVR